MNNGTAEVGFGDANAELAIYLANRPPLDDYPWLDHLKPLLPGELAHIVANTSNHWRKAFNVYAKLLGQLNWPEVSASGSWQNYRDQALLQSGCRAALVFSPPQLSLSDTRMPQRVHIVAGKTYAAHLSLPALTWLDAHFAINSEHRLIVSPYLDYRQLSNARIEQLVGLIGGLAATAGSSVTEEGVGVI